MVFYENPNNAQSSTPQCKWIFTTGRLLVDDPEAYQRVNLVGQRHGDADGIGGHTIRRTLRLVMILGCRGNGGILALRQRVVLAHQALQLREFADRFGEQVGLRELGCALCFLTSAPTSGAIWADKSTRR